MSEELSERSHSVAINPIRNQYVMDLIPLIRLPLINKRDLVTTIKKSNFFHYDSIFEALTYQFAPDDLDERLLQHSWFWPRGFNTNFIQIHENLEMRQAVGLFNDTRTIFTWVDKNESNEFKYVSAFTNEIPLHGIHYFEFRLHSKSQSNYIPKVFVGLCNGQESSLLEDTFKERGSLLFHSYDS
jgi:hypothetical protein